jgi:hypothetical protein
VAKTAKKKASPGPTKKSKSSVKSKKSSLAETPKRSVASTSKTGTGAQPKMSGEQVEKELAMAHKVLVGAAFLINYMLTTRRVSPKRIAEATQRAADAAAYMQRLQKVIQSFAQAG